ncbi:hypothetical protein [Simiduia agarivorans]|uniref:Uncharacterized protein n=1 Tax=Simiduia agarivorans (strain DSM 21679 / JCM 13881 / BCRC 17597 / SA1) TaxID=1117647 RepID=K4KMZ5_SIMAS|nr:hypothetical protein [Simiduia agarivorans]AFV00397.1 hypothetical protein M5M_16330 [Simiduia agarivorans SA1 = DSM 21679]
MAFRRYGGDIHPAGAGGDPRFFWAALGALASGLGIGFWSDGPSLLAALLVFSSFVIAALGYYRPVARYSRIRQGRRKLHIENANNAILAGDTVAFQEAIRRAKIYGPLPEALAAAEQNHHLKRRSLSPERPD